MRAWSNHKPHRGSTRAKKNEKTSGKKRARKCECEGGRKVLLKWLVTAETAPAPLPSSKANWLPSLTPHTSLLLLVKLNT